MNQPAAKQVVIANRLADGRVVFLRADGGWTGTIDQGAIAPDEAEGRRLMDIAKTAEANSEVVDPYLIDIIDDGGHRRPVVYREAIRAGGPTVQTGA